MGASSGAAVPLAGTTTRHLKTQEAAPTFSLHWHGLLAPRYPHPPQIHTAAGLLPVFDSQRTGQGAVPGTRRILLSEGLLSFLSSGCNLTPNQASSLDRSIFMHFAGFDGFQMRDVPEKLLSLHLEPGSSSWGATQPRCVCCEEAHNDLAFSLSPPGNITGRQPRD